MVTIKRVMEHSSSEPTVTITLKGSTPDKDKLLYTLVNGHTNLGKFSYFFAKKLYMPIMYILFNETLQRRVEFSKFKIENVTFCKLRDNHIFH